MLCRNFLNAAFIFATDSNNGNASRIFLQQQLLSTPAQPLLPEPLPSLSHLFSESSQYHQEPRCPGFLTRQPRGTWSRSRCAPSPATRPTAASSGISGDYPSVGLSFSAQISECTLNPNLVLSNSPSSPSPPLNSGIN